MSPTAHLLAALLQREQADLDARRRAQADAERAHAEQVARHERLATARVDLARRLGRSLEAGLDPGHARNRLAWLAGLDAQLRTVAVQVDTTRAARDDARAGTARQQLKVEALEEHVRARAAEARRATRRRAEAVADRDWLSARHGSSVSPARRPLADDGARR